MAGCSRDDPRLNPPRCPSNCLHFLKDLKDNEPQHYATIQPSLNVIIVGAGLAGLATAIALARNHHTVTIFDQASHLAEIGAGIQIPPNSTRLLLQLGLRPYLEKLITEPESIFMRRWQHGKVIGRTRLRPDFCQQFGAPCWVIHRAHFHQAMHALAIDLAVTVKLASRVISYDGEIPSITLADASRVSADLVVAANGVNSTARAVVLGGVDIPPQRTGFAAYRAVVELGGMQSDPDVSWLLKKPAFNLWVGDNRHVMTYVICAGKSFDTVLSHRDGSDSTEWTQDQDEILASMRKEFDGWDPVLSKIIPMIDKAVKLPLFSGSTKDS